MVVLSHLAILMITANQSHLAILMITANQSHHRSQKTIMIMKAVAVTKRRKAVRKETKVIRAEIAFLDMTPSFNGDDRFD